MRRVVNVVVCVVAAWAILGLAVLKRNKSSPSLLRSLSPAAHARRLADCQERMPLPPMPGKKGVGLTMRDPAETTGPSWEDNMPKLESLKPSWSYSWGSQMPPNQPQDVEFIPMVWGYWGEAGVQKKMDEYILPEVAKGNVKRMLGFNEPDAKLQSNLEVERVVEAWPSLSKHNLPLGGPGIAYAAKQWHQDFVEQAKDACLRYEYNAIHWYKNPCVHCFKANMREAYELDGKRPILLTEFAVADWNAEFPEDNKYSQEEVLLFMKQVVPWMEAQDWIAGYVWFSFKQSRAPGTSSALFNEDSASQTVLGQYYATVTEKNPLGDQSIGVPASPADCKGTLSAPPLPGKKGVGLSIQLLEDGFADAESISILNSMNLYWSHSWDSHRPQNQPDSVEFVPSITKYYSGDKAPDVNQYLYDILPDIERGVTKRVLGYDQPPTVDTDLDIDEILEAWSSVSKFDLPITSPSFMAGSKDQKKFAEAAGKSCQWYEYNAVQWFDKPCAECFKKKITDAFEIGGYRPIIITSFAVVDEKAKKKNKYSEADVLAFMKDVLPWLEQQAWVAGYAWYAQFQQSSVTGAPSALFHDGSVDMTAVGKFYASVTTDNPAGDVDIIV